MKKNDVIPNMYSKNILLHNNWSIKVVFVVFTKKILKIHILKDNIVLKPKCCLNSF